MKIEKAKTRQLDDSIRDFLAERRHEAEIRLPFAFKRGDNSDDFTLPVNNGRSCVAAVSHQQFIFERVRVFPAALWRW